MSDSDNESVPPEPAGDAVGANDLPNAGGAGAPPAAAAAPQHPVWAAAAAGRGGGGGAAKGNQSMFGPISMLELEIRGRGDLDGASSTASVRGARGKETSKSTGGKRKRVREYDDEGEEEEEDHDDAGSSASLDMAGAAFGGKAKKRVPRPCVGSEMSDDGASVTSSVVRARHERAFPITGVTCVGCALPAKIQPVVEFISKNMSSMSELALYKMAALVYKTKVAEPAEEEGVSVPPWGARTCTPAHLTP